MTACVGDMCGLPYRALCVGESPVHYLLYILMFTLWLTSETYHCGERMFDVSTGELET